jgi:hypothetical protein
MAFTQHAHESSHNHSAMALAMGIASYPLVLAGAIGIVAVCRVILG